MKYCIEPKCVFIKGNKFYRIVSLIDFNTVKKGEKGGLIQSLNSLNHDDLSWIGYDSCVTANVRLKNSIINGKCILSGTVKIENSHIAGSVDIKGETAIYDSKIIANGIIKGRSVIKNSIIDSTIDIEDARIYNIKYEKENLILNGLELSDKNKVGIEDIKLKKCTLNMKWGINRYGNLAVNINRTYFDIREVYAYLADRYGDEIANNVLYIIEQDSITRNIAHN